MFSICQLFYYYYWDTQYFVVFLEVTGVGVGDGVTCKHLIGLSISKQHDDAKRNIKSWLLPVVSLITDGVQFNPKVNICFSTLKRPHLYLDRAVDCAFVCVS